MERQTATQSTRLTDPLKYQFEYAMVQMCTKITGSWGRLIGAFMQDDTTEEGRDIYAAHFDPALTGYQSNEVERMSTSQLIPGELKEPSFIYLANDKYLVFGEQLKLPNDDLVTVTLVTQTIACGSLEFTVFVILSGHAEIKGWDSVEEIDVKTGPTLLHQLKMHVDTIKAQVEDLSTGAFLSEVLDASVRCANSINIPGEVDCPMQELVSYLDQRPKLLSENEGKYVAFENSSVVAVKDTHSECSKWVRQEKVVRYMIFKIRKHELDIRQIVSNPDAE